MAEDENNGEEQKSSKKLIIIIVVLVLIIAGGGAAFFMMGNDDPSAQEQNADQIESKKDGGEEAEESSNEIIYYNLEQPLRVNFPTGSSASLIEIKVAFLVSNEETIEALKKHEPMIVNNLLMAISAAGADKLKQIEGKNELRALMLDETGKVIKKMTESDGVKEVFFTAFVMQ